MSDISRFLCVLYVFHKNSQKIQKNTCKFVHVVIQSSYENDLVKRFRKRNLKMFIKL